jgi:hypothetical protein
MAPKKRTASSATAHACRAAKRGPAQDASDSERPPTGGGGGGGDHGGGGCDGGGSDPISLDNKAVTPVHSGGMTLTRPTTAVCWPDGSLLVVDNAANALYSIQVDAHAQTLVAALLNATEVVACTGLLPELNRITAEYLVARTRTTGPTGLIRGAAARRSLHISCIFPSPPPVS